MKAPTITETRGMGKILTTDAVEKIANQRLTMFFLKLYFPELLRAKAGTELPEDGERFRAYLSLCQYLEKRPLNSRLAIFLSALDERETECLCLGTKPLPIGEEWRAVLASCESAIEKGEPKIIAFPSGSA